MRFCHFLTHKLALGWHQAARSKFVCWIALGCQDIYVWRMPPRAASPRLGGHAFGQKVWLKQRLNLEILHIFPTKVHHARNQINLLSIVSTPSSCAGLHSYTSLSALLQTKILCQLKSNAAAVGGTLESVFHGAHYKSVLKTCISLGRRVLQNCLALCSDNSTAAERCKIA